MKWRKAARSRVFSCMLVLALGLGATLAAGCASTADPADLAQARGPLPYHVGIYLDTEKLPYDLPESSEALRVRFAHGDDELLDSIKNAITSCRPIVSHAEILDARNRADALREAEGLDLLLAVGFATVEEYTEYERSVGWGALEVVTFFFGGLPSWFIPTVSYDAEAQLTVETLDLHQPRVRQWYGGGGEVPTFDWPASFDSERQATSLWDRSRDGADYLLSLIAFPMLIVPGSTDQLSQELTEGIEASLGEQLGTALREQLLSEDWVKPLAAVFVSPNPLELVTADAIELDLSLANRRGGELRALEVFRLSPDAGTFRWQASRAELDELGALFGNLEDTSDYVGFQVPQPVPMATGANLVKVRLVHESGEQVVRTMLYVK